MVYLASYHMVYHDISCGTVVKSMHAMVVPWYNSLYHGSTTAHCILPWYTMLDTMVYYGTYCGTMVKSVHTMVLPWYTIGYHGSTMVLPWYTIVYHGTTMVHHRVPWYYHGTTVVYHSVLWYTTVVPWYFLSWVETTHFNTV